MKQTLLSVFVLLHCISPIHPVARPELPTTQPPTTLSILWWGSQSRHDATLTVLDRYESLHPGIVFEPMYLDWNGYWGSLYVMAASQQMPDVFQMVIERLPLFHRKQLLTNLEGITSLDLGRLQADVRDLGRVDDTLVAACLGVNALALAYNRQSFDTAGVRTPTPYWRWRDMREASLKIRNASEVFGLNGFGSDNDFGYFVRTRGGHVFNKDLTEPGWLRDTDVTDFYQLMRDYQRVGVVPPPGDWVEEQIEEENSLFALGEAAMRIMWSNKVISVHRRRGFEIEVSRLPGPGSRQGMFLRPAMFFSVSAQSQHAVEAGQFISHFLYDGNANRILGVERGVSAVASVRQAIASLADDQTQAIFYYTDWMSRWGTPMSSPIPAHEAEYRELYRNLTREVSVGRVSPEDAPVVLSGLIRDLLVSERSES